jgi:hypothetical protein
MIDPRRRMTSRSRNATTGPVSRSRRYHAPGGNAQHPAGKTKARNLRLMEDVHDRLWLLARQRKQSVSAGCTTCSTGPSPGGS